MSDTSDNSKSKLHASRRQMALMALAGTAAGAVTAQGMPTTSALPIPGESRSDFSLLDFDVDPAGRNDSTAGFRKALGQMQGARLTVPKGTFLVSNLGALGAAGTQIVGESRWKSVLRSESGGGSIFSNPAAESGTSAFTHVSDLLIDLGGTDQVAIDLASVNASSVQRVHFRGGDGPGRMRGTGVRFAAPIRKGAYDNALHDCTFEYLDRAVVWETGANNNSVFNCTVTNCRVGFDAAPPGSVDSPRIFGGRAERCDIGLREGARQGSYFGVRFEGSRIADIDFTSESLNAAVFGGLTASSAQVLRNLDLASSPSIQSSDLGFREIEESASRPKVSTGRHVFGKPGKSPEIPAGGAYSAYFSDPILAGSALLPLRPGGSELGSDQAPFGRASLAQGVWVGGKKVVGARGGSIADDRSGSRNSDTVNAILETLRAHGLIED